MNLVYQLNVSHDFRNNWIDAYVYICLGIASIPVVEKIGVSPLRCVRIARVRRYMRIGERKLFKVNVWHLWSCYRRHTCVSSSQCWLTYPCLYVFAISFLSPLFWLSYIILLILILPFRSSHVARKWLHLFIHPDNHTCLLNNFIIAVYQSFKLSKWAVPSSGMIIGIYGTNY